MAGFVNVDSNKSQERSMEDNDSADKTDTKSEYTPLSPLNQYKSAYFGLLKAPRDLFIVFLLKFLLLGGMGTFLMALPVYITKVQDYSDSYISFIYSGQGCMCLLYIVALTSVPDRLGLKTSLIIGSFALILAALVLIFVQHPFFKSLLVIILAPFGTAIVSISLDIGMKHYTYLNFRSLAISLFYITGIFSQILGGVILEIIMNTEGRTKSSFRIIFLYCLACFMGGLILSTFIRRLDVSTYDMREVQSHTPPKSMFKHVREVIILKKFWRFCALSFLILLVKVVFYQQTVMLPVYMARDLGEDSHYGLMIIINQLIIISTMPVFTYFNYITSNYNVFIGGGVVGVLSTVPFLFGPSYSGIVLYILLSSVSESLYGPRVLDYCIEISPKGKEGVMITLIVLPGFIGSLIAGVLTGVLLVDYCPKDGERKCWAMWSIVGTVAFVGLLGIVLLRKWLEEPRFESRPYIPCIKESDLE